MSATPSWIEDFVSRHPPLMTRFEAVEATRAGQRTIDRHIEQKTIPSVKVGGRVLIPARSLAEAIAAGKVTVPYVDRRPKAEREATVEKAAS
jgi:excisionase family DNA binding protein